MTYFPRYRMAPSVERHALFLFIPIIHLHRISCHAHHGYNIKDRKIFDVLSSEFSKMPS